MGAMVDPQSAPAAFLAGITFFAGMTFFAGETLLVGKAFCANAPDTKTHSMSAAVSPLLFQKRMIMYLNSATTICVALPPTSAVDQSPKRNARSAA